MRGFHLLVMMVIGDKVKDTQCGFKVRYCHCITADFNMSSLYHLMSTYIIHIAWRQCNVFETTALVPPDSYSECPCCAISKQCI